MGMTFPVRVMVAAIACAALNGCGGSDEGGGSDCVSFYEPVARGATWADLQDAMVGSTSFGRVASVRTQARGLDVGAGDRQAVRVVDLLTSNGRRLVQADVWRTETGAWRAGVWNQCID